MSSALSLPGSSHRCGLGILNPAGGGPEGSAERRVEVLKVAESANERLMMHSCCRDRASVANGLAVAIVKDTMI